MVGVSARGPGYRLVSADGGVFAFGGAGFDGSTAGQPLNRPVIGMAATANGYLIVGADGGVFAFGGASFYGSLGGSTVYSPPPPPPPVPAAPAPAPRPRRRHRLPDRRLGPGQRVRRRRRWNVVGPAVQRRARLLQRQLGDFNTFGYPSNAGYATPDQQIRVAVAFAIRLLGQPNAAPDQSGCSGGY